MNNVEGTSCDRSDTAARNQSSGVNSIEVNNIDDAKYNVDNAAIPVKAPDAIDAMPVFPPRSLTMAA